MIGGTASPRELRGKILRSVSRSFYVSIRLLPAKLQDPVALGYLLARATDTVADTIDIPVDVRKETLAVLANSIQGNRSVNGMAESIAPLQKNEAERTLLQQLPACLEWLDRLTEDDRADIRTVLSKITRAQTIDLECFGSAEEPSAFATATDLHEYTYLIAGSVGEFWTRLCVRHIRDVFELAEKEMLELGRRYGAGLQLVNIVRDAHSDLRAGRCYFPKEELDAIGLNPSQILSSPDRFEGIHQKWREEAAQGLKSGMQYVGAIRSRRIRGATALPALIGARTVALLRKAGRDALEQKIKVPRDEVRGLIRSIVLTGSGRKTLHKMFDRLLG